MEASQAEARSMLSKWQEEGSRLYCVLGVDDVGSTAALVAVAAVSDAIAVLGLLDSSAEGGRLLLAKATLALSTVKKFEYADESDPAFQVELPNDLVAAGALRLTWSATCRCVLIALADEDTDDDTP